jgi:glycosyltransferase involved in cell wall biosynthesis
VSWFKTPVSPVRVIVIVAAVCLAMLAGLIGWDALETQGLIASTRYQGSALAPAVVEKEKARQEYIGKLYENESRGGIVALLASIASAITLIGAVSGGLIALFSYVDARQKEIDARRKEALDRAASDLKDTLTHLAGKDYQERVVGVVGLQHFLVAERSESHRAALTALVAASRMAAARLAAAQAALEHDGTDPAEAERGEADRVESARIIEEEREVLRSIRIAIEQAVRTVREEVLSQVSWQRVNADSADLRGAKLDGLDLRDAELRDAQLDHASLNRANLTNAKLQGAKLDDAHLAEADLTYADLAGASLARAELKDATFSRTKVLDLNLDQAKLEGIKVDADTVPWEQTRNWRTASYSTELWDKLIARFPAPSGPHIVMLMWEIPPFVAGGTWTACYHLVRNLLHRGARLTIVVPWDEAAILTAPFGNEVKVVPMGIRLPEATTSVGTSRASPYPEPVCSPYATAFRSPYGGPPWSPYGGPPWSAYGGMFRGAPEPPWSPYSWMRRPGLGGFDPYGPYPAMRARRDTRASMQGSLLFRLIGEFRNRFQRYIAKEPADLIHAHDWVTFEAAREGAQPTSIPWVAHVHSIEIERQPAAPDELIKRIERRALASANAIVVPSNVTARRVAEQYGRDPSLIHVVPNVLSPEPIDPHDTGRFESGRVIYLGRLSHQKGIDRFLDIAAALRHRVGDLTFDVFGSGEVPAQLYPDVRFHGALGWARRNEAFRDASLLIVPSRAEPFGMVIPEGMQHRVPVIYPADAGAAEVLQSGIRVSMDDSQSVLMQAERVLTDLSYWEDVVEQQLTEVTQYANRGFEQGLITLWDRLAPRAAATAAVAAPPAPRAGA